VLLREAYQKKQAEKYWSELQEDQVKIEVKEIKNIQSEKMPLKTIKWGL